MEESEMDIRSAFRPLGAADSKEEGKENHSLLYSSFPSSPGPERRSLLLEGNMVHLADQQPAPLEPSKDSYTSTAESRHLKGHLPIAPTMSPHTGSEEKLKQLVRQRHNIYRLESCLRQYELERIEASQVVERINDLIRELNQTATEIFKSGGGIMDNLSLNENLEFDNRRKDILAHLKLKRAQLAAADANVNNFIELLSQLDPPDLSIGQRLPMDRVQPKGPARPPYPVLPAATRSPLDNCGTPLRQEFSKLIGSGGAAGCTTQGQERDSNLSRQVSTLPRNLNGGRYASMLEEKEDEDTGTGPSQLEKNPLRSSDNSEWYTLPSRLPLLRSSLAPSVARIYDSVAEPGCRVPMNSVTSAPRQELPTPPTLPPRRSSTMARARVPQTPPRKSSLRARVVNPNFSEESDFGQHGDVMPMSAEDAEVSRFMSKAKQMPQTANGLETSLNSTALVSRVNSQHYDNRTVLDYTPPPPPYYVNMTFPEVEEEVVVKETLEMRQNDVTGINSRQPRHQSTLMNCAGETPIHLYSHAPSANTTSCSGGFNLRHELQKLGHPLNQLTMDGYGQMPSNLNLLKQATGFRDSLANIPYSSSCFSALSRIFKPSSFISRLIALGKPKEVGLEDPLSLLESKVLITSSACRGHLYLLHDRPQRTKPRAWSSIRERVHQRPSFSMLSSGGAGQEVSCGGGSVGSTYTGSEPNSPVAVAKMGKKFNFSGSASASSGWMKHWFECSLEHKRFVWFPNHSECGDQPDHILVDHLMEFINRSNAKTLASTFDDRASEVTISRRERPSSCDRWTQINGDSPDTCDRDLAGPDSRRHPVQGRQGLSNRHDSVESLDASVCLADDRVFGLKTEKRTIWLKAHTPELKALWMDVLQITKLMSLNQSG